MCVGERIGDLMAKVARKRLNVEKDKLSKTHNTNRLQDTKTKVSYNSLL